jgi:hypothetical protein
MLSPSDRLPETVQLYATHIIMLSGTSVISPTVANQLAALHD